jgi:hypothetical protein
MDRSPDTSADAPAPLEERVRRLEGRLDALAEAIEALAHGLENGPMADPRDRTVERAARRAYELALLARSQPPDHHGG